MRLGFSIMSRLFKFKLKEGTKGQKGKGTKAETPHKKNGNSYTIELIVTVFLLLVSFPLWILICILIKLESKGPVFFIQERVGLCGRPFKMVKFRSMYYSADPYQISPGDSNDPRITRVGKKIRDMGLDELPQLLNVLKGDMALVGPRPEMGFVVSKYTALQSRRLLVKPGITGLWQIMAPLDRPIHENIRYDLYYVRKKSFFLDCRIILNTWPVLLLGRNRWNKRLNFATEKTTEKRHPS